MVVGHALHNDFQALKYVHPRSQTRDTTYVPNLLHQPGLHTRTRVSLKDLALQLLHKKIQVRGTGEGAMGCAFGLPVIPPSPVPGTRAKYDVPHVEAALGVFSTIPIVTANHILAGWALAALADLSSTWSLALSLPFMENPQGGAFPRGSQ